jgi:DNA-binding transcriptional MerR regulator
VSRQATVYQPSLRPSRPLSYPALSHTTHREELVSSSMASRSLYTTGHLATELGIGTSMARRYGLALEAVTGEALRQVPGKGRMYSERDIQLLREARQALMEQPNSSIEDVLRSILGIEEPEDAEPTVEKASRPAGGSGVALVDLQQALTQALTPVAAALQELREENRQLRQEIEGMKALPAPAPEATQQEKLVELYRATLVEKNLEIERLQKRRRWWPW